MTIYHGSTVIVEHPRIIKSNHMKDFGNGFYTTTNREQAIAWAQIVAVRQEATIQYLSTYEFDFERAKKELAIIKFDKPNKAWLDFVCANRCGRQVSDSHDMVFGPVANDKVYRVIQFYENGVYDIAETIKRLKVDKLYDQIFFHTEKSLEYCKFIKYEVFGAAN